MKVSLQLPLGGQVAHADQQRDVDDEDHVEQHLDRPHDRQPGDDGQQEAARPPRPAERRTRPGAASGPAGAAGRRQRAAAGRPARPPAGPAWTVPGTAPPRPVGGDGMRRGTAAAAQPVGRRDGGRRRSLQHASGAGGMCPTESENVPLSPRPQPRHQQHAPDNGQDQQNHSSQDSSAYPSVSGTVRHRTHGVVDPPHDWCTRRGGPGLSSGNSQAG